MVKSELKTRIVDDGRADFHFADRDALELVVADEDVAEERSHGEVERRFLKLAERVPAEEPVAEEVNPRVANLVS